MEKLFQEFDAVGAEAWVEKIKKDLKGKSEELLTYQPEKDIQVRSYYHRSEYPAGKFGIGVNGNAFTNRKIYGNTTNKEILNDLNTGIDHISVNYQSADAFEALTDNVKFEFIQADAKFDDIGAAKTFSGAANIRLNFDPLSTGTQEGKWENDLAAYVDYFKSTSNHKNIWVRGNTYGDAGASSVQELAFVCNHLNEYLQILADHNVDLSTVGDKVTIELSITEDYFLNIAKYKVIRHLVKLILAAHGVQNSAEISVYAVTSVRSLSQNDANNNLLRQTTQAMSAIIGGCDALTVVSPSWADETHQRMAKNIPLVLKEESFLDKVGDPAEGAYYIEELCQQLLKKSWELFKAVEKEGGFVKAIEANFVQKQIIENKNYLIEQLNSGSKTLLGVNKYPSSLEDWKDVVKNNSSSEGDFMKIETFKFEQHIKKEVHEQS